MKCKCCLQEIDLHPYADSRLSIESMRVRFRLLSRFKYKMHKWIKDEYTKQGLKKNKGK